MLSSATTSVLVYREIEGSWDFLTYFNSLTMISVDMSTDNVVDDKKLFRAAMSDVDLRRLYTISNNNIMYGSYTRWIFINSNDESILEIPEKISVVPGSLFIFPFKPVIINPLNNRLDLRALQYSYEMLSEEDLQNIMRTLKNDLRYNNKTMYVGNYTYDNYLRMLRGEEIISEEVIVSNKESTENAVQNSSSSQIVNNPNSSQPARFYIFSESRGGVNSVSSNRELIISPFTRVKVDNKVGFININNRLSITERFDPGVYTSWNILLKNSDQYYNIISRIREELCVLPWSRFIFPYKCIISYGEIIGYTPLTEADLIEIKRSMQNDLRYTERPIYVGNYTFDNYIRMINGAGNEPDVTPSLYNLTRYGAEFATGVEDLDYLGNYNSSAGQDDLDDPYLNHEIIFRVNGQPLVENSDINITDESLLVNNETANTGAVITRHFFEFSATYGGSFYSFFDSVYGINEDPVKNTERIILMTMFGATNFGYLFTTNNNYAFGVGHTFGNYVMLNLISLFSLFFYTQNFLMAFGNFTDGYSFLIDIGMGTGFLFKLGADIKGFTIKGGVIMYFGQFLITLDLGYKFQISRSGAANN